MHPQYYSDYEFATERALHGSEAEQRLAKAYLELHDQLRDNGEDCPYCGCPSS